MVIPDGDDLIIPLPEELLESVGEAFRETPANLLIIQDIMHWQPRSLCHPVRMSRQGC
jgi:hypothetical protein